jgi:hypothetical protein
MRAIVTLVAGKKYQTNFARYVYKNWKAYADKHGIDLLVYDKLLDHSQRAQSRSAAWQKCLVMDAGKSRRYEQVAWLDSDIVINNDKAPCIFDDVSADEIGAVQDFVYPGVDEYRKRLEYFSRTLGEPGPWFSLTPQEYMTSWGLPATESVVQTGVIVANPAIHGAIFKNTYDRYEDKGGPVWHYEMRPLSYEILTNSRVKWLDPRFNLCASFGFSDEELEAIVSSPPGILERGLRKLDAPQRFFKFGRYKTLSKIYERLLRDSYFLHFAGRQSEMIFLEA